MGAITMTKAPDDDLKFLKDFIKKEDTYKSKSHKYPKHYCTICVFRLSCKLIEYHNSTIEITFSSTPIQPNLCRYPKYR